MQSFLGRVMILPGLAGSSLHTGKSHTFSWFITLVKKPLVLFFLTLGKKSDDKTYNTTGSTLYIMMHVTLFLLIGNKKSWL